ncbi:MAG: HAD family hydrolase [Candidatus Aenigmarchaeota archaeon]|nr:HAD family hydrolase [Candidatus Aenigmarchaeota archaeon]
MLEGIELIVFDMDGVLTDSKESVWYAFKKGLSDVGIKVNTKQLDENILGRGIKRDITDLIPEKDPVMKRAILDQAVNKIEEAKISEKAISMLKSYPEVREVLKTVRERGFLMALVSNSHRVFVEATLYKLKLDGFWDKIIAKDDGFETKDDALIFLMEEFGVTRKQTVYIGDMILDINAARKAGCKIISKPGWDDENKLRKENPDFLINSLKELI